MLFKISFGVYAKVNGQVDYLNRLREEEVEIECQDQSELFGKAQEFGNQHEPENEYWKPLLGTIILVH